MTPEAVKIFLYIVVSICVISAIAGVGVAIRGLKKEPNRTIDPKFKDSKDDIDKVVSENFVLTRLPQRRK